MFKKWIIKLAVKWLREIDDPDLKREILTEAVRKLYNAISADDILRQEKDGTWIFQGRPLTGVEVSQLKEEANYLKGMKLFYIIKQDLRHQIGKKIWEEAKCMDDILWGQLITWIWDVINTRIKKM